MFRNRNAFPNGSNNSRGLCHCFVGGRRRKVGGGDVGCYPPMAMQPCATRPLLEESHSAPNLKERLPVPQPSHQEQGAAAVLRRLAQLRISFFSSANFDTQISIPARQLSGKF
jgi:hypothetical protein